MEGFHVTGRESPPACPAPPCHTPSPPAATAPRTCLWAFLWPLNKNSRCAPHHVIHPRTPWPAARGLGDKGRNATNHKRRVGCTSAACDELRTCSGRATPPPGAWPPAGPSQVQRRAGRVRRAMVTGPTGSRVALWMFCRRGQRQREAAGSLPPGPRVLRCTGLSVSLFPAGEAGGVQADTRTVPARCVPVALRASPAGSVTARHSVLDVGDCLVHRRRLGTCDRRRVCEKERSR